MPAFAQGCPGKILRSNNGAKRPADFVLAGLVPAIHAFARPKRAPGSKRVEDGDTQALGRLAESASHCGRRDR